MSSQVQLTGRRVDVAVDAAVAAVTISLQAIVVLGVAGPVRALLALAFLTFAPGWAVLDHVRLAEGPDRVALALVISLTVCTLAAVGSLWLELWHPSAVFCGLAVFTLVGVGTHLKEVAR